VNNQPKLEYSKILVTGGAGFIGSNLCEVLLSQNNKVVCLDNLSTGFKSNIEHLLSNPDFKFMEGDIRDFKTCQEAVAEVDFVMHQAALGSVPRSIKDPMTTTDVNIGGFVNMLYASVEAKVKRFVYAASSSTYGDHPDLPKQEHIIGKPLSPYAITKYVDELFAKNFSDIYGIETIGLRYFNVFGRKQTPNGAYAAVIPKFVIQLINHESPVINGDGSYSRDFTYIDNVLHANQIACLRSSQELVESQSQYNTRIGDGQSIKNGFSDVFNVAYGGRTDLVELANYLKANLSKYDPKINDVELVFGPNRAGDIPHSQASIEKGKVILGYDPQFSVEEGLKIAVDWYWENLKDSIDSK